MKAAKVWGIKNMLILMALFFGGAVLGAGIFAAAEGELRNFLVGGTGLLVGAGYYIMVERGRG